MIASRSEQCANVHAPSSTSSSAATRHARRTVTVSRPLVAGSSTLVALITQSPATSGAVYCTLAPSPVIVPQLALQVTRVSLPPPTVALTVVVAPRNRADATLLTATVTGVTVTVAAALLLGSADDVAVMV
jgi:hypothetical protein